MKKFYWFYGVVIALIVLRIIDIFELSFFDNILSDYPIIGTFPLMVIFIILILYAIDYRKHYFDIKFSKEWKTHRDPSHPLFTVANYKNSLIRVAPSFIYEKTTSIKEHAWSFEDWLTDKKKSLCKPEYISCNMINSGEEVINGELAYWCEIERSRRRLSPGSYDDVLLTYNLAKGDRLYLIQLESPATEYYTEVKPMFKEIIESFVIK